MSSSDASPTTRTTALCAAADLRGLDAIFRPRRVALVGASDEPGRVGTVVWRNLATFPGEVIPVRRSGAPIDGRVAYRSLVEVPGHLDLAVVAVPAPGVPQVARDAATAGVSALVVLSGGFAETGPEGQQLQDELGAICRAAGIRVIGPNGLGVINSDLPLQASMAAGEVPGGGGISLVTQSGAYGMAIPMLAAEEQAGFAKVCSVGNQLDVSSSELLTYLAADPDTRVAAFFLESLPDARAFADAVEAAAPLPVVVARTGRSAAGARAAASHTAALGGEQRIERDVLAGAGAILVRSGLELMDVARVLASQPAPAGRRVGIVTNSGGTGVELTDLLAAEGLEVPELSARVRAALAERLPAHASTANPVDVTPVWQHFATLYPAVVAQLARSGEVDVIVTVLLQRAARPEVTAALAEQVTALRDAGVTVPVVACWVAPRSAAGHAAVLQSAGVPCLPWPERTARALGHAVRWGVGHGRTTITQAAASTEPASKHDTTTAATATGATAAADASGASRLVGVHDAHALLAHAGIPLADAHWCTSIEDAVEAAAAYDEVVVKLAHDALVHRTELGAVRTRLRGPAAVRRAAQQLLAVADDHGLASGGRLLVQPQHDGVEVVVGGLRDERLGAVVMVGLGGIHVEVLDDVAFATAPVDPARAATLWRELRAARLLTGTRGRAAVDLDALAAITVELSLLLATNPDIAEVELNPVLVGPEGAVAVDWRILRHH